ncbi:hypothetical protein IU498_12310 [Nocardia beijingensis]|nr:hypothetical protein [Nocardia beijingensis]
MVKTAGCRVKVSAVGGTTASGRVSAFQHVIDGWQRKRPDVARLVVGNAEHPRQVLGDLIGGRRLVPVGVVVRELAEAQRGARHDCHGQFGVPAPEPAGASGGLDIAASARCESVEPFWAGFGHRSRLETMKLLLTAGVVVLVLFGISKLRRRSDADMWHEVTTR